MISAHAYRGTGRLSVRKFESATGDVGRFLCGIFISFQMDSVLDCVCVCVCQLMSVRS